MAAKFFVFVLSRNLRNIFNFVFHEIFQIQNNVVTISCFAKILTKLFRSHPMKEWRRRKGGGVGSEGGASAYSVPSVLTQIVPILASIYTVFHSVIFNSVVLTNNKLY